MESSRTALAKRVVGVVAAAFAIWSLGMALTGLRVVHPAPLRQVVIRSNASRAREVHARHIILSGMGRRRGR